MCATALRALDRCRPADSAAFLSRCITEPSFLEQQLAQPENLQVAHGLMTYINSGSTDAVLRRAIHAVCLARPAEPLRFVAEQLMGR